MKVVNSIADWDGYSTSFQSVMPSQMLILNKDVASYMHGEVTDYGCGSGKIIPFVLHNKKVTRYTGIDASPEMVEKARWMCEHFSVKPANIREGRIEDITNTGVSAALSINSYYAWSDSGLVLAHIYQQLDEGALFILATINPHIDMLALLDEAEMEMIAHPHWNQFRAFNTAICQNPEVNFVTLDALVKQTRAIGFTIEEAHQKHYRGGLNILVLRKPLSA